MIVVDEHLQVGIDKVAVGSRLRVVYVKDALLHLEFASEIGQELDVERVALGRRRMNRVIFSWHDKPNQMYILLENKNRNTAILLVNRF